LADAVDALFENEATRPPTKVYVFHGKPVSISGADAIAYVDFLRGHKMDGNQFEGTKNDATRNGRDR
jgi:hypothetical protein